MAILSNTDYILTLCNQYKHPAHRFHIGCLNENAPWGVAAVRCYRLPGIENMNCLNFGLYTLVISILHGGRLTASAMCPGPDVATTPGPNGFPTVSAPHILT